MTDRHFRNAALLSAALLWGCNDPRLDVRDFDGIDSRSCLLAEFGEPDYHHSYDYQADVVSLNEPGADFSHIEQWEYDSYNEGMPGRTIFWFYVDEHSRQELLRDYNWLSYEELNSRF